MSGDALTEVLTSSEELARGRLFTVSRDHVTLGNGVATIRDVVHHPGAAAVVARTGGGKILMVRQWRHPVASALWELPAGTVGEGEEPQSTARRELQEETGYAAHSWSELGRAALAPGYSSEMMYFFAAADLEPAATAADEDELLEVGEFTLDAVRELSRAHQVDVKTIAGLALAGLWNE